MYVIDEYIHTLYRNKQSQVNHPFSISSMESFKLGGGATNIPTNTNNNPTATTNTATNTATTSTSTNTTIPSSSSKLFSDLLESSKSLPTASSDLGSIQLSINELHRRTKELQNIHHHHNTTNNNYFNNNASTIKRDSNLQDHTKAHYLLAGSGLQFDEVDTSLKILEKNQILSHSVLGKDFHTTNISSNTTATSTNQQQQINPNNKFTEIDNYLKVKKDENILSSIELLLSNAAKDFDNYINDNLNLDWDERKNIIKQNFGILINKKQQQQQPSSLSNNNNTTTKPIIKKINNDNLMKFWSKNNVGNKFQGMDLLNGNDSSNNQQLSKLNVNEHYMLRDKFEKNAKIIHRFNNSRQQRINFPLNHEFINLLNNNNINDSKQRQLLESWKILESFQQTKGMNPSLTINNLILNNAKTFLENQFKDYVDMLYNKQMDEGLPTNINKIKSFIEKKLKNNNQSSSSSSSVLKNNSNINGSLSNSNINGSIGNLINNNINNNNNNNTTGDGWKINNLTIVNGIPIWALIFYLLRAGMEKEALEVMINNKASFKKIEQSFITYFKAYIHSKNNGSNEMPLEFITRLHNEYSQHIKNSLNGDPYRLAVYKIIGRCDLTRKSLPSITLNVEDWLWIHFMLIKEDSSQSINHNIINDSIYEKYTLLEFQQIVLSYGVQRFNNYYLQILLLCGLFEYAIEYAYSINEIDAVHLAIGICNQHLLTVSNEALTPTLIIHEDVNSTTTATTNATTSNAIATTANPNGINVSINFVKIITSYIKSFKFSDPRIALEYLLLIGLTVDDEKNQIQKSFMHECIRELVLETKEFSILLGKISHDGTRIPGVIEQRKPLLLLNNDVDNKEYLKIITEQAALRADEDGRIYDSLLLYQLSEEYDIVITIINNIISNLLSDSDLNGNILVNINDNSETNPILLAEKLINIHLNNNDNINSSAINLKNKETCLLLLQIVEIRKLFDNSNIYNVIPNENTTNTTTSTNGIYVGQWEEILNKIAALDILPLIVTNNSTDKINPNDSFSGNDEMSIRKKAEEFNLMDANVIKCIPNLLIITMISINKTIERLKNSMNNQQQHGVIANTDSEAQLDQIRVMKRLAKNCMIYAGMIQYKMPRETYSTLIQIDIAL